MYHCDGAWGDANKFFDHLISSRHISSFKKHLEKDVSDSESKKSAKFDNEEALDWAKEFKTNLNQDLPGYDAVEVIVDEERYWIQARRGPPNRQASNLDNDETVSKMTV